MQTAAPCLKVQVPKVKVTTNRDKARYFAQLSTSQYPGQTLTRMQQ